MYRNLARRRTTSWVQILKENKVVREKGKANDKQKVQVPWKRLVTRTMKKNFVMFLLDTQLLSTFVFCLGAGRKIISCS